ncbi:golvesin C-terminal-like domain-containing protein [Actinacidiphila acidipaludis]|uniref:Golvesin/Xly CBD-like domain-containing protein n=1 Tax=Actinacidiphila acidipaludis TaxID=2873382 RepID=A0ABS7PYU2_9ACTN|nr:hypothetical protein [Streptomyces acidipaludis]MBY8876056.1 hypothetical protein [Streptomyces acidipaludis]
MQLDDGDAGTAAKSSWPYSGNTAYTQYAVTGDYAYNKDTVAGDTYTWQPTVPAAGSYRVDVHSVPASDRATNAPYTVTYNGGTYSGTVDQSAGTGGVWRSLNNGTLLAGRPGKGLLRMAGRDPRRPTGAFPCSRDVRDGVSLPRSDRS